MSRKRCRTCKHWDTPEDQRGYAECGAIPCRDEPQDAPAYTSDDYGAHSPVYTRPDFGCILHEPR